MSTRETGPAPIDCDVCDQEITATKGGFLDCEVVDLHDGEGVIDVCRPCTSKPLTEILPRITQRTIGHPMRRVPGADVVEEAPPAAAASSEEPPAEEDPEIPPEKKAEKVK